MSAIQHIVASDASEKYNNLPISAFQAVRHNAYMDEQESNGGANHLRAWRAYRGLSQLELAEAVGTSHQIIGYLERGRTQLSAKWLRQLAPALETTPGMLLDHDPTELSADVIDIWSHADTRTKAQIADIARTLTRTGTDS